MKVLNLYAGIGGNRKLWADVDVTAIENNPDIANIYQDFFPNDKVIVTDAHQYLLEHYKWFDFIWSSPPCPTHSRVRKHCAWKTNKISGEKWLQNKPVYPDMKLYEEIIFLENYFEGKWLVENVIAFYKPLIRPNELGSHWFWANFYINNYRLKDRAHFGTNEDLKEKKGFDLDNYRKTDKKLLLRNCVEPELGLHIFKSMNNQELKLAI